MTVLEILLKVVYIREGNKLIGDSFIWSDVAVVSGFVRSGNNGKGSSRDTRGYIIKSCESST